MIAKCKLQIERNEKIKKRISTQRHGEHRGKEGSMNDE
jgi:hypothetical protein